MSRRDVLIPLIPASPPCFSDRLSWVEFVVAADEAAKQGARGPIDMRKAPPRFNPAFDFCSECPAKHSWKMQEQGRCKPNHLRDTVMEAQC